MCVLEAKTTTLNHFLRFEGGVLDANEISPCIICCRRSTSKRINATSFLKVDGEPFKGARDLKSVKN